MHSRAHPFSTYWMTAVFWAHSRCQENRSKPNVLWSLVLEFMVSVRDWQWRKACDGTTGDKYSCESKQSQARILSARGGGGRVTFGKRHKWSEKGIVTEGKTLQNKTHKGKGLEVPPYWGQRRIARQHPASFWILCICTHCSCSDLIRQKHQTDVRIGPLTPSSKTMPIALRQGLFLNLNLNSQLAWKPVNPSYHPVSTLLGAGMPSLFWGCWDPNTGGLHNCAARPIHCPAIPLTRPVLS